MDSKKVVILPLILSVLLFMMVSGTVLGSMSEEVWTVYDQTYAGLEIVIETQRRADPGENVTVTIRAEARSDDVYVDCIDVYIYALNNEGDKIQVEHITHLENSKLAFDKFHQVDYIITIPNDTCAGLAYGVLQCEWEHQNAPEKIPGSGFVLTYVSSRELEQLQLSYDELNATYHFLLANYTEIDSKYAGELGGVRNLMYVFVGTTIVAVVTVLYLVLRRPKGFWS